MISKSLARAAASAAVIASFAAAAAAPLPAAQADSSLCLPGVSNPLYCPQPQPQITATMQWTFAYRRSFTKVLLLLVNGASGTTVVVDCHGQGCPYGHRSTFVAKSRPCGKAGKRTCPTYGMLDLSTPFQKHRLVVGTKLSVAITRPGWIGKYYLFAVRPQRGPRIQITCLAPGLTQPAAAC